MGAHHVVAPAQRSGTIPLAGRSHPALPVSETDLRELLESIAPDLLAPGEVLTEAEMNERVARFTDETALLRRHLVDHGLVERTRSGSEYALAEPVDNS